ncbi:MAG: hypothetical protein HYV62_03120, partial [Candidatus Rokubacteria bacterium]|nr:hypothetical protein [Candidatus Rokubacteria bacterium]
MTMARQVTDTRPIPADPKEDLVERLAGLPGELVSTEKVDDVLETLNLPATGAAEEPGPSVEEVESDEDDEALEESLSPEDPVRLYLREIGRIPLLTAEQEVELGQRIERGQERVRRAIMAVPLVRGELMRLADALRK